MGKTQFKISKAVSLLLALTFTTAIPPSSEIAVPK
jgi:hypothetical protein